MIALIASLPNYARHALTLSLTAALAASACDSTPEPAPPAPVEEPRKPSKPKLSEEELIEARRQAGFKTQEELAAEAKEAYEADEKSFVKEHLAEYRGLIKRVRSMLDQVEKQAPQWAKSSKPDDAVAKFRERSKADMKAFFEDFNEVTEKGSRGGDLQAIFSRAVGQLENLNGDLSPTLSEAEGFPTLLAEIRKDLDELEAAMAVIESDESIEPHPAPKPTGKKK